jgi:hypothetical protein
MVSKLRAEYFEALGFEDPCLAEPNTGQREFVEKALARAYELRSFEIEHYWKRATYFWGYQVAIFAALGLVAKSESKIDLLELVIVLLSGLGVLTALANALSARGSKFWQQNWEKHIDMLEDTVDGRLHKTVWAKNGRGSYSVSKVNQTLSWIFFVFWILVFATVSCISVAPHLPLVWPLIPLCAFMIGLIALVLVGAIVLCCQRSDFGEMKKNLSSRSEDGWSFVKRSAPRSKD